MTPLMSATLPRLMMRDADFRHAMRRCDDAPMPMLPRCAAERCRDAARCRADAELTKSRAAAEMPSALSRRRRR